MALGAIIVVIITIFIPPLGASFVAGCGADLLINILLTILGYFPGHIHAFYLEYQYYHRRDAIQEGAAVPLPHAPGCYSDKIQNPQNHGVRSRVPVAAGVPPPGYGQEYGTMPAQRV